MHVPTMLSSLVLLAAIGCSTEPIGGVTATADKALYEKNDPIQVEIVNTSANPVNYAACPGRWDHKTTSGYQRFEELTACPTVVTSVPAGGSVHVTYSLPEGQPLGTWRIAIPVTSSNGSARTEIHTDDFQVVVFEE